MVGHANIKFILIPHFRWGMLNLGGAQVPPGPTLSPPLLIPYFKNSADTVTPATGTISKNTETQLFLLYTGCPIILPSSKKTHSTGILHLINSCVVQKIFHSFVNNYDFNYPYNRLQISHLQRLITFRGFILLILAIFGDKLPHLTKLLKVYIRAIVS